MKADECIFFQLAKTNQKASRFWYGKIGHLKITAAQALVINFLSEEDNVTSNRLGERTILDSATLTGILDRLETIQLIERKPNPKDRRAILIQLTKKGRDLAEKVREIMVTANLEFLSALGRDEEAELRSLLARIRAV